MGDHRAEIKISFWFHGKTYKAEWWMNYIPDDNGVDNRIIDFFCESYEDGMARHQKHVDKMLRQARKQEIEKQEREELARLQEKYNK